MTDTQVADTRALTFHLDDGTRLGARGRAAFRGAEAGRATIAVPVIVPA